MFYELEIWKLYRDTLRVRVFLVIRASFPNPGPEGGEDLYQNDIRTNIVPPSLAWVSQEQTERFYPREGFVAVKLLPWLLDFVVEYGPWPCSAQIL